jgi:hypothetical protein
MKYKILKWIGLVLVLEAGLLHIIASEAAYLRTPYLGYLLAANFFGTLVAAVGIHFKQAWGWILGCLLALGSLISYAWDSTFGLPLLSVQPWLYPFAIAASVSEILFIVLALTRPWALVQKPFTSRIRRGFYIPSALLVVALLAFPMYQWDNYASEVGYHIHVGSYGAVCSLPFTTLAELDEQYGIQVSLVAISMMDGIVDVRLKITDPDKAYKLLVNQSALLVDTEFLVLAPHHHHVYRLIKDKIHFMFFPTQNKTIHTGSQVSLVFGNVRVEPVTVR